MTPTPSHLDHTSLTMSLWRSVIGVMRVGMGIGTESVDQMAHLVGLNSNVSVSVFKLLSINLSIETQPNIVC